MFQSSIAPKGNRNPRRLLKSCASRTVPILDRPERQSQSPTQPQPPTDPCEFQSSIAPKGNRNSIKSSTIPAALFVPILDRPERQSQSIIVDLNTIELVPILDRPERQSQFLGWMARSRLIVSSNPRSPRKAIAIRPWLRSTDRTRSSNPRSPRKAIAMVDIIAQIGDTLFQSSIAPKGNRNGGD